MAHKDEDTYIIPHNYSDNGKIFGVIEKQSVYVASVWFIPMTMIVLKALPFPIDIRIFLEIILVLPVTLIITVGIGGDTFLDFMENLLDFKDNAKVYKSNNIRLKRRN